MPEKRAKRIKRTPQMPRSPYRITERGTPRQGFHQTPAAPARHTWRRQTKAKAGPRDGNRNWRAQHRSRFPGKPEDETAKCKPTTGRLNRTDQSDSELKSEIFAWSLFYRVSLLVVYDGLT